MADALVSSSPAAGNVETARTLSGPRFRSPFGFLAAIRRDPLAFLQGCQRQYGDVVEIRFWPWRSYAFFRPEHIRHILQENHRNYWKGIVIQKVKRIGGEGLVFSDGDLWRRQRQLIQPAFHRARIAALADMMVDTTAAMLDRWQTHAPNGQTLDIAEEMSTLALEIVAKALFGTELGAIKDEVIAGVTEGMTYANYLINHYLTPPLWVPTKANCQGRRALARLDRIVNSIIAERRRDQRAHGDLFGMLIDARDAETNAAMDDKQLRDEIVTFLVAGHETTAVALAWTWYLLAQHPDVEARLHATVGDGGAQSPSPRDFASLPYVRMTFEESMRLYPPVWGTSREAYGEDDVGGAHITPRTTVSVSPYVTHRHPALWEDPERFDPERFSAERSAERPEYAYFPFGGGPRGCVGKQFAMMEGQIILGMIAQRFTLRPGPGARIEPYPIFTLRPRYGMPMTLHARS